MEKMEIIRKEIPHMDSGNLRTLFGLGRTDEKLENIEPEKLDLMVWFIRNKKLQSVLCNQRYLFTHWRHGLQVSTTYIETRPEGYFIDHYRGWIECPTIRDVLQYLQRNNIKTPGYF